MRCTVIGFALLVTSLARGEDPPPEIDLGEVRAELERSRQEFDALRARLRRESDCQLVALAETLPPVRIPRLRRPDEPWTAASALTRGLGWLGGVQRRDGAWPAGAVAQELAAAAFESVAIDSDVVAAVTLRWSANVARRRLEDSPPPMESGTRALATRIHLACRARGYVKTSDLVRQLLAARNEDGGWGLRAGAKTDPSSTAWAFLALHELQDAGRLPHFDWSVQPVPGSGPVERIAELLRRLGRDGDAGDGERLAAQLVADAREGRVTSPEAWYLGTVALKRRGHTGPTDDWQKAMTERLVAAQGERGSWSEGRDHSIPSRVRATALAVLCLHETRTLD